MVCRSIRFSTHHLATAMKTIVMVVLLLFISIPYCVEGLTSGEISTLEKLLETYPALSNVLSTDEYTTEQVYQGGSWTKPLDTICGDGIEGWDVQGIHCSEGRINKIRFTESWGQNVSAIPDLSSLTSVKSVSALPTYLPSNYEAYGPFLVSLAQAVSLDSVEIATPLPAVGWPLTLYPSIYSVKDLSLVLPNLASAPTWSLFTQLENVSLSFGSEVVFATLSVFSGSKSTLRAFSMSGARLHNLTSASDFPELQILDVVVNPGASPSATMTFGASLTYLRVRGWPTVASPGVTTISLVAPALRSFTLLAGNKRSYALQALPSSLEAITLGSVVVTAWPTAFPLDLKFLRYEFLDNLPVLPAALSSCASFHTLEIQAITGLVDPDESLVPTLASTQMAHVRLLNIGTLPSAWLDALVCGLPRETLHTLALTRASAWRRLPPCIAEFTTLQTLHLQTSGILFPNLLINVSSSVTDLAVSPYPTSRTVPNWTALVTQFPHMRRFELFSVSWIPFENAPFPSAALANWTQLTHLTITNRDLRGPIPANWLHQMQNLEFLDLSGNLLAGPLPSSGWGKIQHVLLGRNGITDWPKIDAPGAPALKELDMSENRLVVIPPPLEWASMVRLQKLNLRGNDNLEGWLPTWWTGDQPTQTTRLAQIDASNTKLRGSLPNFASPFLKDVQLTNLRLCGSVPSFTRAIQLNSFEINQNRFSGVLPTLTNLRARKFDVSENRLHGTIPQPLLSPLTSLGDVSLRLNSFSLFNNYFTGQMPDLASYKYVGNVLIYGPNMTLDYCGQNPNISTTLPLSCSIGNEACECISTYYTLCGAEPACPSTKKSATTLQTTKLQESNLGIKYNLQSAAKAPMIPPTEECEVYTPPPSTPSPSAGTPTPLGSPTPSDGLSNDATSVNASQTSHSMLLANIVLIALVFFG